MLQVHRPEDREGQFLTPHLSTGKGAVVEGEMIYFSVITKHPGQGSEPHYHPNELLIFPLEGSINALVGRDRRVASPGTFVHVPPCARHSMKATESGQLRYLYIKDKTWSVVGLGEDEAVPDQPPTVKEVNDAFNQGLPSGMQKDASRSRIVVDGLGECFYPMTNLLRPVSASGPWKWSVLGKRIRFTFVETPGGENAEELNSDVEQLLYVIEGRVKVSGGKGANKMLEPGDLLHVPTGDGCNLVPEASTPARFAYAESTQALKDLLINR